MKNLLTTLAALLMGSGPVMAQTDEVVKELNRSGFWMPYVQWLQSDERMEGYLSNLSDYSIPSMESTLEWMERDHERAKALLDARKDIVGRKKGKKATALLEKHFTDVAVAMKAFDAAAAAEKRIGRIQSAIKHEIKTRPEATMPSGRLNHFSFSNGNGFAGYHEEVTLDRNENGTGGKLSMRVQRMRTPEEMDKKPQTVEVADSVLQRVRDIIEAGKLYEVGKNYMSDVEIMDASSWSMYLGFEEENIFSGGYAAGPDHSDTLSEVIQYLKGIAEAAKGDDDPDSSE